MSAARIALALAGRRPVQRLADGGYLIPCPAPGHGKGRGDRNPSLRISDGDTRLLVHCFAGCDTRDVLSELNRRGIIDEAQPSAHRPARSEAPIKSYANRERRQREKADWLWRQRRPIKDTCAELYLREVRGYAGAIPTTLAFLPPQKPEHHSAMIAAFDIPTECEPGVLGIPGDVDAVHLTLLRQDGSGKANVKPNKIVVGRPLGRPIVLAPANDLFGLAITEGIEDALSAYAATGLGAWAAGSAGYMPMLADAVPDYIEAATIFGHADKVGQVKARKLAEALEFRGIEVRVEGII
jgi:hypothetical protein